MQLNDGNINGMDMPEEGTANWYPCRYEITWIFFHLTLRLREAARSVRFLQLRERLWWPWSVS